MSWYRWEEDDLVLHLRVQPRAGRDGVVGPHGGRLKVRITAPPVDGAANEHLCAWIASLHGVNRRDVELLKGVRGRDKDLKVRAPGRLLDGVARVI